MVVLTDSELEHLEPQDGRHTMVRQEIYEKIHDILGLGRYVLYLMLPIFGLYYRPGMEVIPNAWYIKIPMVILITLGVYMVAAVAFYWFAWAHTDALKHDPFETKYFHLIPSAGAMLILAWILGNGMITSHDLELKQVVLDAAWKENKEYNDEMRKRMNERLDGIESDRGWAGSYNVEIPRGMKVTQQEVGVDGRFTYWIRKMRDDEEPETSIYQSGPLGNLDRTVVFHEQ